MDSQKKLHINEARMEKKSFESSKILKAAAA